MKKVVFSFMLLLLLSGCAGRNVTPDTTASGQTSETQSEELVLDSPAAGESVQSPLTIKGSAPGNWFFEGTLPVTVMSTQGALITAAPATALEDWMQEGYVDFEATLVFSVDAPTPATLQIMNDNPSGMPENSKKFELPVTLVPSP